MKRAVALGLALAGLIALPAAGHDGAGHESEPASAAPELLYELPAAGSYELPAIRRVGEHALLDPAGRPARLPGLEAGQGCALVAFIYLHCTDAAGCPLALASLQRADRAIASRPELRERVRLVTVSFDPARDRPEAMARLREGLAPRSDWSFLTAADEAALRPVLADYGQDAVPLLTAGGEKTGLVRHVTKVFLVDRDGAVRNVYSSGFLDHRLLLRDVETLLLAP